MAFDSGYKIGTYLYKNAIKGPWNDMIDAMIESKEGFSEKFQSTVYFGFNMLGK